LYVSAGCNVKTLARVYLYDIHFGMEIAERLRGVAGFQWDRGNANKNWIAHQVQSNECEQVFFNQPLIVAADRGHSADEERFFVLGQTDGGRELFLVFTLRDNLVRVISARDMSRRERKEYRTHG